jgi:hypothetical protein
VVSMTDPYGRILDFVDQKRTLKHVINLYYNECIKKIVRNKIRMFIAQLRAL